MHPFVSGHCFHQLALRSVSNFPLIDSPVLFLSLSTQAFSCTRFSAVNTSPRRVLTPSSSLPSDCLGRTWISDQHKSKSPEPLGILMSHVFFAMRTFVLSGFNLWNLPRCSQLRAFCLYLNGGGEEGETDMPKFPTEPVSESRPSAGTIVKFL